MEEKQPTSSAEIDLSYFFRPFQKALAQVGKWVMNYYLLITNNGVLFFSIIFLVTGAAYSLRYVIHPSYRTKGIFISRVLTGKYCTNSIESLNSLKSKANIPLMAQHLRTSQESAATINNVEVTASSDSSSIDTRDTGITILTITLTLNNMEHLDSIQQGIVKYLENMPYALKRKEAKIQTLQSINASLEDKILSLDSIRKLVSQSIVPRSQGQGIILGEPIDPVKIYNTEMAYYKEQLRIAEDLKLIDNIEVLQPFTKVNKTNYPNYTMMLIMGFLASLFATLVLTPILGRRPKAKRVA